jgi:bacillithiol biosynthesis cysteine-adding enzyme BshC
MGKSIPFHNLPGFNPIFLDYIRNFNKVSAFFNIDYRKPPEKWVIQQNAPEAPKEFLIEGLLQDADRWKCRKKTIKNIETLRDPKCLAVITGQQVGLYGGPLYTYYKALSAILWAKQIKKVTGRPTVPIFWMETSDHDFYEVNHARLLDLQGQEVSLALSQAPNEKRRVVGSIPLNGEIEQLTRRLYHILPANSYRGLYMEILSSCYRQGVTLGDAFAQLFSKLFSDDGLILFDTENKTCKKDAAPLLDKILASTEVLNQLLEESTKAVAKKNYPPQISPHRDRMQLFYKEGEIRIPITDDGRLLYDDNTDKNLGIAELRKIASDNPDRFLPKVSLRPIIQDYLFPTAAYCAGPTEIAYFAQLKPLYEHLGITMPVIIPRLSITLLETKIKKILEKYQFTPEQLNRGAQELINEMIESDSSNDVVGLFAEARKKWEDLNHHLTLGLIRIDPTLQNPTEKTLSRWQQGLQVLEEKARAALSHKSQTLVAQTEKACTHLCPNGVLQERRYSLQYYLFRYGRSLFDRIRAQTKIDLFKHQLINLSDETKARG